MKVVGGTVAWNQLVSSVNATSKANGITRTQVGSTSTKLGLQYTGTCELSAGYTTVTWAGTYIPNHVYYLTLGADLPSGCRIGYSNIDRQNYAFLKPVSAPDQLKVYINQGTTVDFTVYPQIFDLTQVFGTAIPDYIYSLEQATAGSGIAWLQSYGFLTKDYYAYNVGSLESVKTSALKTVGFNQWDEQWRNGFYNANTGVFTANNNYVANKNPIMVLGSTQIHFHVPSSVKWAGFYYDSQGKFIGRTTLFITGDYTITTPPNCVYMNFYTDTGYGTAYNNDICINFHYDGERDGEYEAYEEHTDALDSNLELRGIPKLDSNNNLYYDGDVYHSDGTVDRRYGAINLGTLNWTYNSDYDFFNTYLSTFKPNTNNNICKNYLFGGSSSASAMADKPTKTFYRGANNKDLRFKDTSYNDADTFKASLDGVYLIYEKETPTTETADAFQEPQIVDNWGTEEFVDERTVPVPVGHDSLYADEYSIIGHTGVSVIHGASSDDPNPTTYTVLFTSQGIVYGGTVDIVSGVLTLTWGYIASYNGETLTGEWMSSKDVYVSGTTPSLGAEVAYELASPITYQLTAQQVDMLLNNNYFSTAEENMTIKYLAVSH